jgi:hypothetical protein
VAIVVPDIPDAMRDIEGRQLLAVSMGSAADRGQGAAPHSEVPAALLIGAWRQRLCICRKSHPRQCPERTKYYFQLQLPPVDEPDNGWDEPEISGRLVVIKPATACGGGNA